MKLEVMYSNLRERERCGGEIKEGEEERNCISVVDTSIICCHNMMIVQGRSILLLDNILNVSCWNVFATASDFTTTLGDEFIHLSG